MWLGHLSSSAIGRFKCSLYTDALALSVLKTKTGSHSPGSLPTQRTFLQMLQSLVMVFHKTSSILTQKGSSFKNASCSCRFSEQRLTPQFLSLTVIRRIDSASLSSSQKTLAIPAGTLLMQSMFIWANWIANSETKAVILERAFNMIGINFYNRKCGGMGFFEQKTQEWHTVRKAMLSFCGIFTPKGTEDGRYDLLSYCGFGLEFCRLKLECSCLKSSPAHSLFLGKGGGGMLGLPCIPPPGDETHWISQS